MEAVDQGGDEDFRSGAPQKIDGCDRLDLFETFGEEDEDMGHDPDGITKLSEAHSFLPAILG